MISFSRLVKFSANGLSLEVVGTICILSSALESDNTVIVVAVDVDGSHLTSFIVFLDMLFEPDLLRLVGTYLLRYYNIILLV